MPRYIQPEEVQKNEFGDRMRRKPTPSEQALWALLHQWGIAERFNRQKYIGGFIADFYCSLGRSIVIEVDGSSHKGREAYDQKRDEIFQQKNINTVRVTNHEVIHAPELVKTRIFAALGIPLPDNSSPVRDFQGRKFTFNHFGERVSFSFRCGTKSYRNTIATPGADGFDKNTFLADVVKLFGVEKLTNLSLVIAEPTRAYKKSMFVNTVPAQGPSRQVSGFIVTPNEVVLDFVLDAIAARVTDEQVVEFITRNCVFEKEGAPVSVALHSSQRPRFQPGIPGKYVSQLVIAHQTAGGVTSFSTLYADVRRVDCGRMIEDFEALVVGKVVSVSRRLLVPRELDGPKREPRTARIIQASGQAFIQNYKVKIWKLEGVDEQAWRNLSGLKRSSIESAIEWFLLKYLRMGDPPDDTERPDRIVVSRLSILYSNRS
ncbi:MAG: endonuclease domain-containing protein [Blastocatellia bacterium]|nr:endonuclease domain-containing protein [Blastocatellia bacterium]